MAVVVGVALIWPLANDALDDVVDGQDADDDDCDDVYLLLLLPFYFELCLQLQFSALDCACYMRCVVFVSAVRFVVVGS